jgi:hypothetical protein
LKKIISFVIVCMLAQYVYAQGPTGPVIAGFSPDSGTNNTMVMVYGINLNNVTGITFGGQAAAAWSTSNGSSFYAYPANGASGAIQCFSLVGGVYQLASKSGFTFIPRPIMTSFSPLTAIAGDTILIQGKNFTAANVTSVSFGGVDALSYGVVSDTLIKATVGSGMSGSVAVTISVGGTASMAGFVYNNMWTGAVSTAWENPGNWSCGVVPDSTTNVVINGGTVIVSSNATVKSLTLNPVVNFTIASGYNLTITD